MNQPGTHARQRYQARAEIARALAHPSRLLILDLLGRGPRCVRELTQAVGADQSTVSKHLAVLRQVGIVRDCRRGQSSYYELCCPCLENFWECLESTLRHKLRTQQAALGR